MTVWPVAWANPHGPMAKTRGGRQSEMDVRGRGALRVAFSLLPLRRGALFWGRHQDSRGVQRVSTAWPPSHMPHGTQGHAAKNHAPSVHCQLTSVRWPP